MHWKEQLKAKIKSLKEENWQSDKGLEIYASTFLHVVWDPAYPFDAFAFAKMVDDINDREFCGVGRGRLRLGGFSCIYDKELSLQFILRKTTPWNIYRDENGELKELMKADGTPRLYHGNFDSLP
jgi:hypothetical protein